MFYRNRKRKDDVSMGEKKIAIQVQGLEKAYKLYDKPSDRLKEALGLDRKSVV